MNTPYRPRVRLYSPEQLGSASTYQNDRDLEKVARTAADMVFDDLGAGRVGRSEFRREVLAGKHAEVVAEYIKREHLTEGERARRITLLSGKLWAVKAPEFLTIDVQPARGLVYLRGAGLMQSLEARVRRCGGWRVDKNTLATNLIHAEKLPEALNEWMRLNKQKRAGARFAKAVAEASKGRVAVRGD